MKFLKSLITIALCFSLLSSCVKKTDTTAGPNHVFDPKIPGGIIGSDIVVLPVTDAVADVSVLHQITLSWTVPELYIPLDYSIRIYKHRGSGSSFVLPDPSQFYNSANLYKVADFKGSTYLDANPANGSSLKIEDDSDYTYWIYVFVNNHWSPQVTLTPHSKAGTSTFALPSAANFWNNKTWSYGYDPIQSATGATYSTMKPGLPSIGQPKGKTAFAYDGAVMYIADTENNRVLIYTREAALACSQYHSDQQLFQACQYQAQGFPFEPTNIIGQPDQYSTRSCVLGCSLKLSASSCGSTTGCSWDSSSNKCHATFGMDQCLTKPTSVAVFGNELFISDSGNNRVVIWDHLPQKGCDPNIVTGQTTTADCIHAAQIGKQSLFDETNNYTINSVGDMTFNNPTGVAVKGSDLYVADTGNNRVVKIANYTEAQSFSCNPTNWGTSLCKFSGVLGQPSLFVANSFNSLVTADNVSQTSCTSKSTVSNCLAANSCYWTPAQIGGACRSIDTIIDPTSIGEKVRKTVGDQSICSVAVTQTDCMASTAGQGCSCSYDVNHQFNCSCVANSGFGCAWDTATATCSATPASNKDIMKKYFANPTRVIFTDTGKLLISANENYSSVSPVTGSPILLKSRILIYNTNPLDGLTPACTSGTFSQSVCDANDVIGQQDFNTLVPLSSNTAKYSDVSYGLESLSDFDVMGKFMIGTDSMNNFVYLWNDWATLNALGHPPDGRALNPNGRVNPNSNQNLPTLSGLGSVTIVPILQIIYVTDSVGNRVHEVKGY